MPSLVCTRIDRLILKQVFHSFFSGVTASTALMLLLASAAAGQNQNQIPPQLRVRGIEHPHLKRDRTQKVLYARIIQHEDERLADETLIDFLSVQHLGVRIKTMLALGRIGSPVGVAPIVAILKTGTNTELREVAAFALGQISSQYAVTPLLETLDNPETPASVRGRAAEALGKIASTKSAQDSLGSYGVAGIANSISKALPDSTKPPSADQELVAGFALSALLRLKDPSTVPAITAQLKSSSPSIRWQAANTLSRIGQGLGPAVPVLIPLLADRDPLVRSRAARALGAAKDTKAVPALVNALSDNDARVVEEAVRALGNLSDAASVDGLVALGKKQLALYKSFDRSQGMPPAQNILLLIATSLGNLKMDSGLPFLKDLRVAFGKLGGAPEIEVAMAQYGEAVFFDSSSGLALPNGEWQAASAYAEGLGYIDSDRSRSALLSLLAGDAVKVQDPRAVPVILQSMAKLKEPKLEQILLQQLKASDIIVRATAAELLATVGDSSKPVTDALEEALKAAHNDKMNYARLAIIETANKLGHPFNSDVLDGEMKDEDYVVRRTAANLLKQSGTNYNLSALQVGKAHTGHNEDYWKRMAGYVDSADQPVAILHTIKGDVTIKLFSEDAPMTVDNFIQLAKKGFFNGLAFIRVVPDFVIQGGDPRGDMNGDPGYQIRDEINLHLYETGSVGMALSGKDTGGSQFFITHSPQPHLDGGYTVFGQVVQGMDVVNQIARGDVIRSVEITGKE